MDKALAQTLAAEAEEALKAVAARYGLKVKCGGGKYDPAAGTFAPKVEFLADDGGKTEWDAYCRLLGFQPEDHGRTFTAQGHTHTLVGIRPRARSKPIVTRQEDGREFIWASDVVRKLLGKVEA